MKSCVAARRFYLGKSIVLSLAGVTLLAVSLMSDVDMVGKVFSLGLAVMLFLLSRYNFGLFRRSRAEDRVYESFESAPPDLKLQRLNRLTVLTLIVFPLVSALTAWELWMLESGQAENASLIEPLGNIYRATGFWPPVIVPLLAGLVMVLLIKRLRSKIIEI